MRRGAGVGVARVGKPHGPWIPSSVPSTRASAPGWLQIALLLALVTAGCGLPTQARLHDARRQWQESAAPSDAARDPLVGAPQLERPTLVRAVLARNPNLRAARHAWRAALQRVPQVTSFDDPRIGYGVAPRSFGEDDIDDAHQLDLAQRFPFPGKRALRGEAALAEAEAARGDFAAVRLRLATMASLLYDEHYYLARALEVNAEHLALLRAFKRVALARYEAGEATQQDPLQAEVELARLLQIEIELATAQRVLGQQLNALLHRPIDAPLPPAPEALAVPVLPALPLESGGLTRSALDARPELDAAGARVKARQAELDAARREYFPDLTLVGNYNGRMPLEENRPFVGIQLELPLQLGRRRAAVEEARSRVQRAESLRVGLADELALDVHRAHAQWRQARDVSALFDARLLPAARDRVAAARAGFETGRNSFLELIDAERGLREIELGAERALTDLSRRAAELLRSLGRLPGLEEGSS